MNRHLFSALLAASLVCAMVSGIMTFRYTDYHRDIVLETRSKLRDLTQRAALDIDSILLGTMADADWFASDMSKGNMSENRVLNRLERLVEENDHYYGASLAFRPYGYKPSLRLYSPYFKRSHTNGKIIFSPSEEDYDYTLPQYEWYSRPMQEGNRWSTPYWCPAGKTYMVTYSSVFYERGGNGDNPSPLGLVAIDISMDHIKKIIENIDLGPSGFGILISGKGMYLYHPDPEYVVSGKRMAAMGHHSIDRNRDPGRDLALRMASQGESGILDHITPLTREPAWMAVAPVPTSGWSLQNTFLKRDIETDVDLICGLLIGIVSAVLAGLLFSIAAMYWKTVGNRTREWALIAAGSICIALGIGFVWKIALTCNPADKISGQRITDKATLRNVTKTYVRHSRETHTAPPIVVPTAVFMESIKFTGPSDILVSGYIRQTFRDSFPKGAGQEFMISNATDVTVERVDTLANNGHKTVLSYFEATVRQKLNHRTYPLEQDRIELSIRPKEIGHHILLVPDLDAYAVRNASHLPGLAGDAFIPGWKLKKAFFELRQRAFNTDSGLGHSILKGRYPDLYYTITIQRIFIDVFISNLTPLIFVAIMLFLLLLLSNTINGAQAVSICVAMFLVIVFSHIDIRKKISAQEIFYLEYFFFLTYVAILYVSINAAGALLKREIPFCSYRGKGPRRLFWPIFLGLLFTITIGVFFPF